MMKSSLNRIIPRHGNVLRALGILRTSDAHEQSFGDQEAMLREHAADHCNHTVEWHFVKSHGAGCLHPHELHEVEMSVRSRCFDLVAVQDLSRLGRNGDAIRLCELCQDCNTPFISVT